MRSKVCSDWLPSYIKATPHDRFSRYSKWLDTFWTGLVVRRSTKNRGDKLHENFKTRRKIANIPENIVVIFVRQSGRVLKSGAGEGWRISVDPIARKTNKYCVQP
jgi:hypothetical protein